MAQYTANGSTSSPQSNGPRPSLNGRIIGRHKHLLSDPAVRSWWEARSLRSRLSADQFLRQLGLLLERTSLSPKRITELARREPDRLRDILTRDAARLKREGKLDSYISKYVDVLKAYLRFQHIAFDGFPALAPITGASLSDERVPTRDELARILDHLSLRGRVLALFMAHSGLRPGVIGSYQGENGLRLVDLPDLKFEHGKPTFAETPFVIRVPASLSKTRVAYVTFGSAQLASALLAYFEARQQSGDTLTPESPVIAANSARGIALYSHQNAGNSNGFLTTKVVVEEIRSALKASVPSGVRWRPYVLRAYCSTRLLMAVGSGKMTHDLREAILGHDGGVASRYHVGKRWGQELLDEARRQYGVATEFLETSSQTRVNVAAEFRRALLDLAALPEEEAKAHMNDTNEQIASLVRERLMSLQSDTVREPSDAERKPPLQKPVTFVEAERLLSQGWTFVSSFGPDRVLLQAPTT